MRGSSQATIGWVLLAVAGLPGGEVDPDDPLPPGAVARFGTTRFRGGPNLAFSPDGSLLASADADGQVVVWNARTGQAVRRFQGKPQHRDHHFPVAISPDSATLAF